MSSSPTTTASDISLCKMRAVHFSNEFPYDDQQTLFRDLHRHSKERGHPLLAQFLDEATRAVREEVRMIPSTLKTLVPPFETVLDLVNFAELRKGPLSGSIDGVLLCIVEVGTFIGQVQSLHSDRQLNMWLVIDLATIISVTMRTSHMNSMSMILLSPG